MSTYPQLKIAVFADGAKIEEMVSRHKEGFVKGFTTNPTLMAKAGVKDYAGFAKSVLQQITDLPISFEVFSDDFAEMEREAMIIKDWGKNVNVKIPIINTRGESAIPLIRRLLDKGLKLNITAIFAPEQIESLRKALRSDDDVIVSIFAGRIADSGRDPMPMMKKAVEDYRGLKGSKILWASSRETYNIFQADQCGCHIITAPDDQIAKLKTQYQRSYVDMSLDAVRAFLKDSTSAGFKL